VAGCTNSPTAASGDEPLPPSNATYYVAANEPGAHNDRCDGRSPVDSGNGRCPFKDFGSPRTLRLLTNVSGVRVEVRAGTYSLTPSGLVIQGRGSNEAEAVVLAAYGNETVIFDGGNVVRELIRVSGQYVAVQGLTLQNSGAYNLEVRGAQHVLIQGNRFLANRASDSLKGDGGAADVHVRGNEFTQWDSQAIDMTTVARWRIEENLFHDPKAVDGNAIGVKFGSRDIVINRNQFFRTRGLSLGGVAASHPEEYEAYNVIAEHNIFENIGGAAAVFYSCAGCQFRDNDVSGGGGGIDLSGESVQGPSGCAGGCRPNQDAVVMRNRFRFLTGAGQGPANVFWAVRVDSWRGLDASNNLYCRQPGEEARFWYENRFVTFDEWARTVQTDGSSAVASLEDARCGW
jgi:hypothetical protein